jgi:hypothetical protein
MKTPSLTIFANFRINNEERYLRMRDSFLSFKNISAEKWVINIRGSHKEKTLNFLNKHLEDKLYHYQLESKKGWFADTREMLKDIDSDFVLFWIEDHINIADVKVYNNILHEMKQNGCNQLTYTWWYHELRDVFAPIKTADSAFLDYFDINLISIKKVEANEGRYIIPLSIPGIFSYDFFENIIKSDHPKLKRWPRATPFDFEKRSTDIEFMNFKHALPKFELFASIDDNNRSKSKYCLIDRGLYEDRVNRWEMLTEEGRVNKRSSLPEWIKRPARPIITLLKRIMYTYG